jgi:hypothetical protein
MVVMNAIVASIVTLVKVVMVVKVAMVGVKADILLLALAATLYVLQEIYQHTVMLVLVVASLVMLV